MRFYTRQVEEREGPVLVLGCATGRVPWALAHGGREVLGVDPSERMIALGEERRAHELPEVAARVRLLCADLRSLRLPGRFPLVLAPQHALGLMSSREDLEALFATVRHHLTAEGVFLYDVLNPPRSAMSPPEQGQPRGPVEPHRPLFARHLRERSGRGAPGGIRRLRLKHFTPEEVDGALGACGLVSRERYGDFTGKPFSPEDPWQVGLAGVDVPSVS